LCYISTKSYEEESKMKNRNLIVLPALLLSLLLVASACDPGTGTGRVFEGGTQGLLLSFVEGTPPDPIYDNNAIDFDMMLRIENAGEYDIDRIHFTISGINRRDFPGNYLNTQGMKGWAQTGSEMWDLGLYGLAGKTRLERETIPGDTTYVHIAEKIKYDRTLLGGGELQYTVLVDACYPYATLATSTICLQRNYHDGNDNICTPKSGGQVSVSGAPLQITSYTQTAVGTKSLRVQYTFQNRANVEIWAPKDGKAQDCDPESRTDRIRELGTFYVAINDNGAAHRIRCIGLQQNENFGVVTIRDQIPQLALTGGAIRVREVQPLPDAAGYLKLVDGKATLTCTLDLHDSVTNSLGTVNVLAAYYVKDSVRKTFHVTHSGYDGTPSTPGTPTAPSGVQLITCQGDLTAADCPNIVYSSLNHHDSTVRLRCDNAIGMWNC
jgi:hypothetical protein